MKICPTCGQRKYSANEKGKENDTHLRLLPNLPPTCNLEFSVVDRDRVRREALPHELPLGFQRTNANQAAWVHPDRL